MEGGGNKNLAITKRRVAARGYGRKTRCGYQKNAEFIQKLREYKLKRTRRIFQRGIEPVKGTGNYRNASYRRIATTIETPFAFFTIRGRNRRRDRQFRDRVRARLRIRVSRPVRVQHRVPIQRRIRVPSHRSSRPDTTSTEARCTRRGRLSGRRNRGSRRARRHHGRGNRPEQRRRNRARSLELKEFVSRVIFDEMSIIRSGET